MDIRDTPIDDIIPYARNPRKNSKAVDSVAASIKEYGFRQPIVVDAENVIIVGHTRYLAAKKLKYKEVPVHMADTLTEQQIKAYRIADNKTNEFADWDQELLLLEMEEVGKSFTGFTEAELQVMQDEQDHDKILNPIQAHLNEVFIVPPFSILDAKQGYWQDRKAKWKALGIRSEEGRDGGLIYSENIYARYSVNTVIAEYNGGTSIFDPVLCELAYKWFSTEGSMVLDPFAGGSVRGTVANLLGREYTGIDLRKEQVEANKANWDEVTQTTAIDKPTKFTKPTWITGDSVDIDTLVGNNKYDLLFSCPPYADLEVYSDDPKDLSNMEYKQFIKVYREIITKSVKLLNDNRFIVWVVGEVRSSSGEYYNFIGDTVNAFIDAGAKYYNEAILATTLGTLGLRAGRQFRASRKLGKGHQNVLVFVKGNPADAVDYAQPQIILNSGELIKEHVQVLVFVKGDPKQATQYCGDVNTIMPLLQEVASNEGDDNE